LSNQLLFIIVAIGIFPYVTNNFELTTFWGHSCIQSIFQLRWPHMFRVSKISYYQQFVYHANSLLSSKVEHSVSENEGLIMYEKTILNIIYDKWSCFCQSESSSPDVLVYLDELLKTKDYHNTEIQHTNTIIIIFLAGI
jgi:hypothetical protein